MNPPHLRVRLERHVTFPHFENINVLVDIFPRWSPSTLLPFFLSTPFWINYFLINKVHSHDVFLLSTQKVLPYVFFIVTQCVHLVSFPNPLHLSISSSFLESTSSFSLRGLTTTPYKAYKCTNRWCWIGIYDPNPFYLPKWDMIRKFMCRKFNFST